MKRFGSIHLKLIILLSLFFLGLTLPRTPVLINATGTTNENHSSIIRSYVPMDFSSEIIWPRISNPAIILNGSDCEIRVHGPNTITTWAFSLYREYRNYTLAYDTPIYNASTHQWHINITIPLDSVRDLYDLIVNVSDGVTQKILIEWNAIQVRYSYPDDFKIYHITDTHMFKSYTSEAERFIKSLYQAAMANADLVFVTGDLVDSGGYDDMSYFHDVLRTSRVPTFICPGNHDADLTGNTYGNYISIFGTDYYTASFGPDVFIVMANSHRDRILNATQIGWIERDMAASNAKTKILGFHHPIYNVEDPPTYYLDPDEAKELLRITDAYNVTLVLTGHLHNDRVDRINGTLWILTTANGGSVWRNPEDPGHHQHAFRIIEFEDYKAVSWNYTVSEPWSQPWDMIELSRAPIFFHSVDLGGYMKIKNTLNYSITGQIVDFIVEPLASPTVYLVSGANVIETVNGSDAWLIRLSVDLATKESTTIRIYTNNSQAPTIQNIVYPASALIGEVIQIKADCINPASGVHFVEINLSLDNGPYTTGSMTSSDGITYTYTKIFPDPVSIRFRITAYDYSGFHTTTQVYTFEVLSSTTSTESPNLLIIIIGGGAVGAIVIIVVAFIILRRRKA